MGNCLSYRLKLIRPNDMTFPDNLTGFSLKSLKRSTNNFATLIRRDECSNSYAGTLVDGSRVVVKVYNASRPLYLDFASMTEIMSSVKHQNVVELIGYCIEGDQKMLVHDFLGDYSLDQYLFLDSKVRGADLDWPQRVSICHGIARAMDYLYNGVSPCVVLRDLKPSNVFIDSSFNPKIVDFEVASILEEDDSDQSATVAGTLGYMDPECLSTGRYYERSDVYAFGVTLLEIISGKRNSRNGFRLNYQAWELGESGRIPEFVDPTISEFREDEAIRLVSVALSCVQFPSELRPSFTGVRLMLSAGYDFSKFTITNPPDIGNIWRSNYSDLIGTPSHSQRSSNDVLPTTPILPQNLIRFSFQSLDNATNHFSSMVRWNGFSFSYNGTLDDGSKVLVKKYETNTKIDSISMIKIMSGLKHKNVVELIGYCLEDEHQLLVHEFIGDYSLDQFLFSDSKIEEAELNWGKRMSICHGIACSLDYLHSGVSPCVVLRNVKPGNVFVDSSFNPKIVDFEFAFLHDEGESDQSGQIAGTFGYMDPEYIRTGRFLKKTDIYSFGITLLEIISGHENVKFLRDHEGTSLVEWALEVRENGRIHDFVDPSLSEFSEYEASNFVSVALSCVQLPAELRPSMSEVRLMLSVG